VKRRILFQYSLILTIALVAFVVGASLIVKANFTDFTRLHLGHYLSIVETEYDSGLTGNDLIARFVDENSYLRITVMAPNGTVLADTVGVVSENHLTRPEFLEPGSYHVRFSATANKTMMYVASVMDDGNYLRVAIPESSILPFLNDFVGLAILTAVLIVAGSVVALVAVVQINIKPLKAVEASLQLVMTEGTPELLPLESDPEVNRIMIKIGAIHASIAETLSSLSLEQKKTSFLLDRMGQGLIVLTAQGNIDLYNRFAKTLFGLSFESGQDRHYLLYFRDRAIRHAVERAMIEHRFATAFFEQDGKYYGVSADYVEGAWNDAPAVLMLVNDVTAIKDLEVMKRDFFANASHELKSPLTSILGSAELITSGLAKGDDQIKDLAMRMKQESERMNRLVLDMLSLSKYEDVTLSKGENDVDWVLLVEDVREQLAPLAAAKGIHIDVKLQSAVLRGDYEHFYELLHNLAENSIKYGVEGGHVWVSLQSSPEALTLEVKDDGIGIPKAEQSRVFERFYRVDKARTQKVSGTGLGLSIVKHIAMLYEGEIELYSEVNKGTTITVRIPKF
jgi:two-component system, OmpR family, phosphate regulon sensor histidine kinase PhoR